MGKEETIKTAPSVSEKAEQNQNLRPLSARECELLQKIANGLTTPEIATSIFISDNTVETHRRNILKAMGANNMMHAVAMGIRNKIID